ncbi:hypothetical protein [Streptomyces europaeiscabiei]|nr:hypothetical protein [Streptomyces europaeiscabiei]MDX3777472.1 hypothetical protein [Streptomyces europaeiscabiei]MDX3831069.1 hypothetical protein [Streptomyces europaeiscabiei]
MPLSSHRTYSYAVAGSVSFRVESVGSLGTSVIRALLNASRTTRWP